MIKRIRYYSLIILSFFKLWKKPKITIIICSILILLNINIFAQRTDLQHLWLYFDQPRISNVDLWTVNWFYNDIADSFNAYKNDTLRVKIRNLEDNWVSYVYIPEMDTVTTIIKLDKSFNYNIVFTFNVIAKNEMGIAISDSISILYFVSDINKIPDSNTIKGYRTGDQVVDGLDLIELSKNFGRSGLEYTDLVDITGDGYVDGLDLIQLSRDFGKTWNP